MFLRVLFYILFTASSASAQQKMLRFIDNLTRIPVTDAYIYLDSTYLGETDYNGNIRVDISGDYKNLHVDHLSYNRRTISRDSLIVKGVYSLNKKKGLLDEVVITSEKEEKTTPPYSCFSHGMKVATLIKSNDSKSIIKKLKFRVTNAHGVKGLNFLPFRANVYEFDTLTKLPGKKLLPKDLLVNNNGAKWAEIDISRYNLKIPSQGVFVVFIIPDFNEGLYKQQTINSEIGAICAVPNLKYRKSDKYNISYIYAQYPLNHYTSYGERKWETTWRLVEDKVYMINIEF